MRILASHVGWHHSTDDMSAGINFGAVWLSKLKMAAKASSKTTNAQLLDTVFKSSIQLLRHA